MTDPHPALEEMRAALEACSYALPRAVTPPQFPGAGADAYAASYRALAAASRTLHRELGDDDPLHETVRRALLAGQQGWISLLLEDPSTEPGVPLSTRPLPSTALAVRPPTPVLSRALVPAGSHALVVRARPSNARPLPDESTLGRYLRRRRDHGRSLPDEAVLVRYLRRRRDRGRRLPDEAAIARYLRRPRLPSREYA